MADFMAPEIVEGLWIRIETACGTWFLPEDIAPRTASDFADAVAEGLHEADEVCATLACDVMQYTEATDANDIESVERVEGFGARLSASGFLDCTDWSVFETEEEAREHLAEAYDVEA